MKDIKMKWITIMEEKGREMEKTKIFHVVSKQGGFLGLIKWYGPWRKYCFFPDNNIVFDPDCLRDIAQFTEEATKKHGMKQ